jgi:hypothetical protein
VSRASGVHSELVRIVHIHPRYRGTPPQIDRITIFIMLPSLIAGWCLMGETPRGPLWTPALMLPHGCDGLSVRRMTVLWTFHRLSMCHPVPCHFMCNKLRDLTTIIHATACH